jgi:hypothetical protein
MPWDFGVKDEGQDPSPRAVAAIQDDGSLYWGKESRDEEMIRGSKYIWKVELI